MRHGLEGSRQRGDPAGKHGSEATAIHRLCKERANIPHFGGRASPNPQPLPTAEPWGWEERSPCDVLGVPWISLKGRGGDVVLVLQGTGCPPHAGDARGPCLHPGETGKGGGDTAKCVSSAAQFQGKFALSQLLKQNVSECQMPGATYALHKRGSINQGAVSGKKSGSKEESSGIRFFFFFFPSSS